MCMTAGGRQFMVELVLVAWAVLGAGKGRSDDRTALAMLVVEQAAVSRNWVYFPLRAA